MKRRQDDFYETPPWATDAILPELGPLADRWVLEPSAGRGAIVKRLLEAGADRARVYAHDTNSDFWADLWEKCGLGQNATWGDFLATDGIFGCPPVKLWPTWFDVIIMNPPYCAAAAHVEHALKFLAPGGACAALLRLAFICSRKRADFRRRHPCDVFPLASRPSFTTTGTDSADYAWFLWGSGRGGRYRVLEAQESETLFNEVDDEVDDG